MYLPVYRGTRYKHKWTLTLVAFALVDDGRADLLDHVWKLSSAGYVWAQGKGKTTLYLARVVLRYDGPLKVSHENGNPLDNRAVNLKATTNTDNKLNPNDPIWAASGYRGVTRDNNVKLGKPWRGKVKVSGKQHCTTRFATAREAAIALNEIRRSLGLRLDFRVLDEPPDPLRGNPFWRSRRKTPLPQGSVYR